MEALIVIGSVLAYIMVGAWTFGWHCAKCAGEYNIKYDCNREPSYYNDEPPPYLAAMFWPIYLVFFILLSNTISFFVKSGEKRGKNSYKNRRLRIALEKKIRIEQQKIEEEAEDEIEEAMRSAKYAAR